MVHAANNTSVQSPSIALNGRWRVSEGVEPQIVYVAMLEDGNRRTCTPTGVAEEFGGKNDPDKATLLKLDE